MDIVVCVKSVANRDNPIRVDHSGKWVEVEPLFVDQMNRYDEYALEQALLIKDTLDDVRVHAVTVGTKDCISALKRAIGMGADSNIHIETETPGYVSPRMIAEGLFQVLAPRSFDLIITGAISEDAGQGLVGPMLAELLSIPSATSCTSVRLPSDNKAIVEREIEGGLRYLVELDLPALITMQSGSNKPRYPSLSNLMKAAGSKCASTPMKTFNEIPLESLVRVSLPEGRRKCIFLKGSTQEKASNLIEILREKAFL